MRKSTPSKPLHITHGLVLDAPCHNHCSFAPRRATASTRALTCCSMSLCSCMYLFHRYRFWTLRSTPRNGAPHQGPEHANIHGTCRTTTCAPLHCYHPCSGKRVSKLPSCAIPFLAVFLHRHTSEIGSMARPVQGVWVPATQEKERNVIHGHSDTSQAAHAYILHVDIADHLGATPSCDLHFTHAL